MGPRPSKRYTYKSIFKYRPSWAWQFLDVSHASKKPINGYIFTNMYHLFYYLAIISFNHLSCFIHCLQPTKMSSQPVNSQPPTLNGYQPLTMGGYQPPTSGGYQPPTSGSGYQPAQTIFQRYHFQINAIGHSGPMGCCVVLLLFFGIFLCFPGSVLTGMGNSFGERWVKLISHFDYSQASIIYECGGPNHDFRTLKRPYFTFI